MIIGINTNVQHDGEPYHIQTEDGGQKLHTLTTTLFKEGAILSSIKTSYKAILESSSCEEKVKKMMQKQHKQMMRDLIRGKIVPAVAKPTRNKPVRKGVQKKVRVNAPETEVIQEKERPGAVRKDGLDGLIFDYLSSKETEQE